MREAPKRNVSSEAVTTDELRSCEAAIAALGNVAKQEFGGWANNRMEHSLPPSRRPEQAMLRFRQMKSLQKFVSALASLHDHFTSEGHRGDRQTCKTRRQAAWAEWQSAILSRSRRCPNS